LLTSLSIKNYALIDELQVDFRDGLTIITGETGAGKSILLGGLSLILGKRVDLANVKDSSKKCIIEATFDISAYKLKSFFKNEDLDYESETIIRREILPSGKSRAFVNDSPVNLNSLVSLGTSLIDIHSQHQTMELANDDFQFQIIDALAKNENHLQQYKLKLKDYKKLKNTGLALQVQKADAIKEHDYNVFLLNELESAKLASGALEALEAEYEILNNVEAIREGLLESNQLLSAEQIGILQCLGVLKNSTQKLSGLSNKYADLYNRVHSVFIELNDVFNEVESAQESIDVNPDRLETVNGQLQIIHNLLLKHSAASIDELLELQEKLSMTVMATENIDAEIADNQRELDAVIVDLNKISKVIHDQRTVAIPKLIKQLETVLSKLGMENAKFNISMNYGLEFLNNGKDHMSFLFTANKGGEFKPLKKAASGGELSRIMLAVKSILAKYIQLPAIMFDEIDTGVSGEISNRMGEIMHQMSTSMQVFTITHLPQIAAKGDTHYKVYKADINNKTLTHLVKLNPEERIVEIAQMLGGKEMSGSAIAHAKQLLN